tara:strand:+ start:375 stop:767 length:393 start_codon:yes stop_codon:yes gene_type:complete
MFLLSLRPKIKKKKYMNTYETVFIMNPVLSEKQIEETVKKITDFLEKEKNSINFKENWGLKKLKYPIQNKKTGFYYLLEFQGNGKTINEFEIELKRDERILRWQTIKLDKYALEYAATRRTKLNNNKDSK